MDNYVDQIKETLERNVNSHISEKYREMSEFLDKNLPMPKPTPKTMPYPPPMGYGSLGKDVTDAVLLNSLK
jgi:hypothetical protein